eukprot:TRINITY_DN2372_c0_g1_i1.p1 TRINITY_DN2372_c0_g1~~TRINITY_DN2372_c0_g1_i1.p1  ORF type:complete len:667 (+),score=215.60 TRINITY_DN2372_c0_g1_i1:2068-4068(+)
MTTEIKLEEKVQKKKSRRIGPYQLQPKRLYLIFLCLMLCIFLAALDNTITSTALPKIAQDFQRFDLYAWVIEAYMITSTIMGPISGRLSDIVGRKNLLMVGVVSFLIGSILCGVAPTMILLVIFRGIQGLGGGILMSMCIIIISDLVEPRERGKYVGMFGLTWGTASVAGPVFGGLISDNISWRWIFYINLPIGVPVLFLLWFFLNYESTKRITKKEEKIEKISMKPEESSAVFQNSKEFDSSSDEENENASSGESSNASDNEGEKKSNSSKQSKHSKTSKTSKNSQKNVEKKVEEKPPQAPVEFLTEDVKNETPVTVEPPHEEDPPQELTAVPLMASMTRKEILKSIDWLGVFLLAAGVVLVLVAVSLASAKDFEWNSRLIIGLLVGGGVILVLFVLNEGLIAILPIMPLPPFKIRNVAICHILATLMGFMMFSGINYLPIYFQTIRGDPSTISGLKLIPMMFGMVVTSAGSGIIITKIGKPWPFPIIGFATACVGVGLLSMLHIDTHYGLIFLFLLIWGLGLGMLIQTTTLIVQASVDRANMASSISANAFLRTIGGVIGVQVAQSVLQTYLQSKFPGVNTSLLVRSVIERLPEEQKNDIYREYSKGINIIFYILIPIAGIGFLCALGLKRTTLAAVGPATLAAQKKVEGEESEAEIELGGGMA